MGQFADVHELVNRLSGGNSGNPQLLDWHKEPRVAGAASATPAAGQPISLWEYEGTQSNGAVPPTTAAVPDNTTVGGWRQTDPSGGRQLWMPASGSACLAQGRLVLYDRLLHISGLSGTVTTAQTVGGAITRYTNGLGNFAAIEIYTQIGASTTSITMNYTNEAGTTGRTSPTMVWGNTNNREAQRFRMFSVASPDKGVQNIASVTAAATTGTAGNFGVIIGHKLAEYNIVTSLGGDRRSFLDGPLVEVLTDACLAFYFVPGTATAPTFDMDAVLVER